MHSAGCGEKIIKFMLFYNTSPAALMLRRFIGVQLAAFFDLVPQTVTMVVYFQPLSGTTIA